MRDALNNAAFTAESATEGHPDKMCDRIADSVLDAFLGVDRFARVSCEVMVATGIVLISGEVTTRRYVDLTSLTRSVLREIGYDDPSEGFDYQSCAILTLIEEQTAEVALAADRKGAGDQGMIVGFATNEGSRVPGGTDLMPVPIHVANRLAERLASVRKDGTLPYLRPDGVSQLTVEYSGGVPEFARDVVLLAQHRRGTDLEQVRSDLARHVVRPVVEGAGLWREGSTRVHVNPVGPFTRGGPHADVGLTGRKIVADTYGEACHHGGSALSGKDATKTDRSAAYAARWMAKNVVAAGLADRCEIGLAYILGATEPVSFHVDTGGTGRHPDERLHAILLETFDLSPAGILEALDLRRPIYAPTSVYGHFGRSKIDLPWERLDRVESLARYL